MNWRGGGVQLLYYDLYLGLTICGYTVTDTSNTDREGNWFYWWSGSWDTLTTSSRSVGRPLNAA